MSIFFTFLSLFNIYVYMNKLLVSIFVSILTIIGCVVFINKNSNSSIVIQRDFIVVKGYGNNLYKYEYPIKKGTTYIEIIRILEEKSQEPTKIYTRKGRSWKEVSPYAKAFNDSTIKAYFK